MNKRKTIIGIDPGKEGFITVKTEDGVVHYPIPTVGRDLDMHELSNLLIEIVSKCDIDRTMAVIEDVHALPRSAAKATFTFGGICYAIRMGLSMLGVSVVLVAPKKWQKEMYEGIKPDPDKKVMSIQAAKRLFPNNDLRRTSNCKKPDDNLTDSLLIAEYGWRHFVL